MSSKGTRYDALLPIFATKNAGDVRARMILDDLMVNSGHYNVNSVPPLKAVVLDESNKRLHVGNIDPAELADFKKDVSVVPATKAGLMKDLVVSLATDNSPVGNFGAELVTKLGFGLKDVNGNVVSLSQRASWGTVTAVTEPSTSVADQVISVAARNPSTATTFTLNIDRFRMKSIMDDLNNVAHNKQASHTKFFGAPTEGYRRDENNELVDKNGTRVGLGSANHLGLTKNSKCYTTAFIDGAKNCGQYFDECLRGTGIQSCKDFLTTPGYWGDMANDIKQMSPVMAVQTLEKFGYRTYKNSNGVVEFESVDDWLKRLTDDDMLGSTGSSDADSIRKNDKLVGYMAAVVAKVNGNPAILNRDLTNVAGQVVNTKANAYGIRPKTFVPVSTTALLHRVSNAVAVDAMHNSILFGLSNVGTVFFQTGGDITREIEAAEAAKEMWHSSMFRRIFRDVQSALADAGKKIQDDDRQEIEKLMTQLEDSERKLFTTMNFATKYVRLMELFGDEDSQKVLNLEDLKKFVNARNKYQLKTTKRSNGLVQVLLKLSEAADGSSDNRRQVPVPRV